MTDEEFRHIRDLLAEWCGLYFDDANKYLVERRLQARLPACGVTSFREYFRLLKYASGRMQELDEVVERVTTNETYFFREARQLKAFTEEIVPALLASKPHGELLRIWSAGCSTGEEPLTIAMLLDGMGELEPHGVDIFASDISRKVLKAARAGVYREVSFRQTDPHYIARYFAREGRGFRISEALRERVTYGHLNLMDEAAMGLVGNVDVIFCRNVMIYFAPAARARLLEIFHRKLRPGGYLLLGHSESLVSVSTEFEVVSLVNDVVYRKAGR